MKKLSIIIAALLWAAPFVMAEPCPCAGGTMPYTKTCGGGSPNACADDDCCGDLGIAPTAGWECCGNAEFDPAVDECCDGEVVAIGTCAVPCEQGVPADPGMECCDGEQVLEGTCTSIEIVDVALLTDSSTLGIGSSLSVADFSIETKPKGYEGDVTLTGDTTLALGWNVLTFSHSSAEEDFIGEIPVAEVASLNAEFVFDENGDYIIVQAEVGGADVEYSSYGPSIVCTTSSSCSGTASAAQNIEYSIGLSGSFIDEQDDNGVEMGAAGLGIVGVVLGVVSVGITAYQYSAKDIPPGVAPSNTTSLSISTSNSDFVPSSIGTNPVLDVLGSGRYSFGILQYLRYPSVTMMSGNPTASYYLPSSQNVYVNKDSSVTVVLGTLHGSNTKTDVSASVTRPVGGGHYTDVNNITTYGSVTLAVNNHLRYVWGVPNNTISWQANVNW